MGINKQHLYLQLASSQHECFNMKKKTKPKKKIIKKEEEEEEEGGGGGGGGCDLADH